MMYFNGYSKLKINVIGYEYENSTDKDDSNWLIVEIFVENGDGGTWSSVNPCLTTMELAELKGWLSTIRDKKTTSRELDFMENELRFINEGNGIISVALNYAFHPNWKCYDFDNKDKVILKFHLDDGKLKRLIEQVDELIKRYPEKSGH